eukprot:248626_1
MTRKEDALLLGQRALIITGIYVGSFATWLLPFVWNLWCTTPYSELPATGKGNSLIMEATCLAFGLSNYVVSKSKDAETVQNVLFITAFGISLWFICDIYYSIAFWVDAYTLVGYILVLPCTAFMSLFALYSGIRLRNALKQEHAQQDYQLHQNP